MKNTIALLCMLLLAMPALAQKKGKTDPKDAKIDSLTKANTALAAQLDTAGKDIASYKAMHTAIKDKVIKYDFAPERTDELIDSLKTAREATFSTLSADAKALNDSLTAVSAENAELKAELAKLKEAAANKEVLVADLRELKSLLDEKVITQEEYDVRKAKLMAQWE